MPTLGYSLGSTASSGNPYGLSIGYNSQGQVGSAYRDAYNSAVLSQYNNDYQYWLWQQQNEYNSPKAQVERLKEAGLNPNYNSIDGTGNASYNAQNQRVSDNVASNQVAFANTGIQAVNTVLKSISEGAQTAKLISEMPQDISAYRQSINALASANVLDKEQSAALKKASAFLTGLQSEHKQMENGLYGILSGYMESADDELWNRMKDSPLYKKAVAEMQSASYLSDLRGIEKEWQEIMHDPEKAPEFLAIMLALQQAQLTGQQNQNSITGLDAEVSENMPWWFKPLISTIRAIK